MSSESSVNHRTIWHLAGPMIIANISTPLLGMVDTAVVGHLDAAYYLGAVAIGSMIFTVLFWSFGFLRMATTGLASQAHGNNDEQTLQLVLNQTTLMALLIAILLLLLQNPISTIAFQLVDASSDVSGHANTYFNIRIWAAPAILLNYAILGWLIGIGASKSALLIILVVNVSNIVLDLLLVNIVGMKVDGVALASLIAEYLGLAASFIVLKRHDIDVARLIRNRDIRSLAANSGLLTLNANVMIRTLCLIFSFAFFTNQGASQSDTILAANALLLNFITFMAFVLDGFANATEVLSGRAIGRKNTAELKHTLFLCGYWSLLVACLFSTAYLLFGTHIIALLTNIDAIADTARHYLPWVVIAPLIGVWSYFLDGLFVGATLGKEMRNTMLFSSLFCYLPAWYLLQPFGNDGLWAALLIFLAARGISQSFYLKRIIQMST